jgi:predicted transcriptional regulator
MSIGKVVRNAGSHRIIYALSLGIRTSKELKNIVGAINSLARFDGEYMQRLVTSGYVRQSKEGWELTRRGEEKLAELGPASGIHHGRKDRESRLYERPIYEPGKEIRPPMRLGSEEFLQWPSRIGNSLYYRDGRIERTEENKDGH